MLLGSEKYNVIYDRIRYLMSLKRGITYIFSFVLEDDIECESFTVISIDSLLVYENKYYLQVYLDNCAYKIVNKQMTDYLDENLFED